MKRSVRSFIQEAPDLGALWIVMSSVRALPCAPDTRRRWQDECHTRAMDFIQEDTTRTNPSLGTYVYNTLFIFLRPEQQQQLDQYIKQRYVRFNP